MKDAVTLYHRPDGSFGAAIWVKRLKRWVDTGHKIEEEDSGKFTVYSLKDKVKLCHNVSRSQAERWAAADWRRENENNQTRNTPEDAKRDNIHTGVR